MTKTAPLRLVFQSEEDAEVERRRSRYLDPSSELHKACERAQNAAIEFLAGDDSAEVDTSRYKQFGETLSKFCVELDNGQVGADLTLRSWVAERECSVDLSLPRSWLYTSYRGHTVSLALGTVLGKSLHITVASIKNRVRDLPACLMEAMQVAAASVKEPTSS